MSSKSARLTLATTWLFLFLGHAAVATAQTPQFRQAIIMPPPNIQFSSPYMLSGAGLGGANPGIQIDGNGNRRFFYSVTLPGPEHMAVRSQFVGAPLGSEMILTDSFGINNWGNFARQANTHYSGPANLDFLTLGKSNSAYVLKTSDNGGTYAFEKNYANGSNGCSSYLPTFMERDLSDTADPKRLVFGYLFNNGFTGCSDNHVYQAQQNCSGTCAWPATATQVLVGAAPLNGKLFAVYESGPLMNLITSAGVARSTNNGATFALLNNANTLQDSLNASDAAIGATNKLYLIRTYTYGLSGVNQHLVFHSSANFGATWTPPQPIIMNAAAAFVNPQIAVSNHSPSVARVLAVWKVSTGALYQQLHAAYSYNGGATWLPEQTIITLNGTDQISDFDVVYDALTHHFLVSYATINASTRLGVYYIEGQ